MTSHIAHFIVNGKDYFAAHTDNGGVRIGNVGGFIIEFPSDHEAYDRVRLGSRTEGAVEALVDEFAAKHMHSGIRDRP